LVCFAEPGCWKSRCQIVGDGNVAILSLVAHFKAARETQGLTLADVAERMGIDLPALSRLETGKMLKPTLATLHKWAEALGQRLAEPARACDARGRPI